MPQEDQKLTPEQIKKFYLGPLTKFVLIPLTVIALTFLIVYAVKGDKEGVLAGVIFLAASAVGTVLSYFNDLRRNR